MIIALTGHREEDCISEEHVRTQFRNCMSELGDGPDKPTIITGMANGFDLWAGTEAVRLGHPVWAARPWRTHQARRGDEGLYAEIVEAAERVVVVTEADEYPGPWVYLKRNEWMVDNAERVLAYWNGKQRGGTYACINYARKVQRPIRNIRG